MPRNRTPTGPPPTVANLQALGVTGVVVTCLACKRNGAIAFERLGVDGRIAFPLIAHMRLVCARCASEEVIVMPDWSGYKPHGGGERT